MKPFCKPNHSFDGLCVFPRMIFANAVSAPAKIILVTNQLTVLAIAEFEISKLFPDLRYKGVSFVKILLVILTALAAFHSAIADAKGKHGHIGKEVAELPFFDAHMHYNEQAWGPVPPKAVLTMMDDSGVAMALVSSTPDEGTLTLLNFAPSRIIPELRPYHGEANSTNWTRVPDMFEYLSKRLANHPYQGVGEFHLHEVSTEDETLLRQIAAIAKERELLIHIHSGKAPVDLLYGMEPDLRIIWAHAGMIEPAKVVEAMMARYDTLYADTSYREFDIMNEDGSIDADWRRVIERFPDRFMIGSDTWTNSQWAEYRDLIRINRKWLSQFSRPVAESIAYKNAERLLGRKVSNHLLETR